MTWTDTANPFTHPTEPDPERPTETLPSSHCNGPYWAIIFRHRTPPQTAAGKGRATLLLVFIALALAAAALVSSLTVLDQPDPRIELGRAVADRRAYLDELYRVTNPEHIRNGDDLCRTTKLFTLWEREWSDHVQALNYSTALAGHIMVGLAHKDTDHPTREGKERKHQLQALVIEAINPPTPESQVILNTEEVITLAQVLIDAGWAQDIDLDKLIEKRAKTEESRSTEDASKIREFIRKFTVENVNQ